VELRTKLRQTLGILRVIWKAVDNTNVIVGYDYTVLIVYFSMFTKCDTGVNNVIDR